MSEGKGIAVVITTQHRGVFFGYVEETNSKTLYVKGMRNCLYWPSSIGGFEGLAATGPNEQTKIGPAVDATLHDITCVLECSIKAEQAWVKAKWNF